MVYELNKEPYEYYEIYQKGKNYAKLIAYGDTKEEIQKYFINKGYKEPDYYITSPDPRKMKFELPKFLEEYLLKTYYNDILFSLNSEDIKHEFTDDQKIILHLDGYYSVFINIWKEKTLDYCKIAILDGITLKLTIKDKGIYFLWVPETIKYMINGHIVITCPYTQKAYKEEY